jgi:hypothetical protein
MKDPSAKSNQASSPSSPNATSSRELEGGHLLSDWQVGPMTLLSGPEAALVSLSVSLDAYEESQTRATCGQCGPGSFKSRALQSYLANRLSARLQGCGSTLYSLTWKTSTTPAGRQICALRASAPRTSAKDTIGWPSPVVNDSKGSDYAYSRGDHSKPALKLGGAAKLAAWATPTPTVRDHKDGSAIGTAPVNALLGRQVWLAGSSAQMANGARLNPDHSRWLMGFPTVWACCGATAMQSFRKSPRRSSKP